MVDQERKAGKIEQEVQKFIEDNKLPKADMLKLVRSWRKIQTGSSHSKCGGHSSE